MVTIEWNENKEQLAKWNYDEPVLEIYNRNCHVVIPASKVCYENIKRSIQKCGCSTIAQAMCAMRTSKDQSRNVDTPQLHKQWEIPTIEGSDVMIEINNVDELHKAILEACKDDVAIDSDRPYDGQPHTFQGERGKTVVEDLTIRDICDCFVLGLLEASGVDELYDKAHDGTACYDDVYSIPDDIDTIAAVQNAVCIIEKMMEDSDK